MHLHTQFNIDLPWAEIDMDYMNLHQSAHGGREYGFINARMRKNRKVVVGHWQNENVQDQVAAWCRTAIGWADSQGLKVARFGDGKVDFHYAKFHNGNISFERTEFGNGRVDFRLVEFGTGRINFNRSQFGSGEVTFEASEMEAGKFSFKRA